MTPQLSSHELLLGAKECSVLGRAGLNRHPVRREKNYILSQISRDIYFKITVAWKQTNAISLATNKLFQDLDDQDMIKIEVYGTG